MITESCIEEWSFELREIFKVNWSNSEIAISNQTKISLGIQGKLEMPKELKELTAKKEENGQNISSYMFCDERPWPLLWLHLAKLFIFDNKSHFILKFTTLRLDLGSDFVIFVEFPWKYIVN